MLNSVATRELTPKQIKNIIFLLLLIMPLIGMAIDLMVPSLPAMAHQLAQPTQLIKNLISIYLFAYAIGNFITGFATDTLGRRTLLRYSLVLFLAASLMPVFFPSIQVLFLARFLQGLALGSVAVLIRSILSDILVPEKLVQIGPLLGAAWGLGPIIGPIIGGYLQYYINWQAGFFLFAFMTVIILFFVYRLIPETQIHRHAFDISTIKKNLGQVFTHRFFMGLTFLMGFVYSVLISFNTLGPFLIQSELNYTPIFFGRLALVFGCCFLSATFICRYLLKKIAADRLTLYMLHISFLTCLISLLFSYLLPKNIICLSIITGLLFFNSGFIFPMSMGRGMAIFRHIAGIASGTMYLIDILITSIVGFLVSFVNIHSTISMIWIYTLLIAMTIIIYWTMVRSRR